MNLRYNKASNDLSCKNIFTSSFFIIPSYLRSDDAWGTMLEFNPELWTEKGYRDIFDVTSKNEE